MKKEVSALKKYVLKIDTTSSKQTIVRLGGRGYSAPQGRSGQVLLPLIRRALKKNKLDWADLTGIEVAPGPGSFTGLRVGFAVANTLGWVLGIPVNGAPPPREPVYEEPIVKKERIG